MFLRFAAQKCGERADDLEEIPMPTIGQVAHDEDFEVLRELLKPISNRPVDQLNEKVRGLLQKNKDDAMLLLLEVYFSACDAEKERVLLAREKKRAHVAQEVRPIQQGEVVVCA